MYLTLALSGETETTIACFIPSVFITDVRRVCVAVTVSAMTFTDGGRMLRISPRRAKSFLKVSPLHG